MNILFELVTINKEKLSCPAPGPAVDTDIRYRKHLPAIARFLLGNTQRIFWFFWSFQCMTWSLVWCVRTGQQVSVTPDKFELFICSLLLAALQIALYTAFVSFSIQFVNPLQSLYFY